MTGDLYPPELLTELYEGDGLLAKIVDMPAEDAAGAGIAFEGISREAAAYYERQLDLLEWRKTAATAIKWQRLFGGAVVVVLADDGGKIGEPLNLQTVQRVDGLLVFDSAHVLPVIDQEGNPESFSVQTGHISFDVHPSRCLLFRSDPLPELADNPITGFFGSPLYVKIRKELEDVHKMQGMPRRLLERLSQAVYKIDGLSSMLSTEQGTAELQRRMEAVDISRGLYSTAIIGEGDEYKQATAPGALTEAAAVINTPWPMLSAVTSIPPPMLAGTSVLDPQAQPFDGIHDDTSPELYSSFIKEIQVQQIQPALQRLFEIIGRAGVAAGALDKLEPVQIRFNPLYPAQAVEKAENELKAAQSALTRAQTVKQYVDAGVMTPEEARRIYRERGKKNC